MAGNSIGIGTAVQRVAASYAFDGGFSLAGGITSQTMNFLEQQDGYGIEAAIQQMIMQYL